MPALEQPPSGAASVRGPHKHPDLLGDAQASFPAKRPDQFYRCRVRESPAGLSLSDEGLEDEVYDLYSMRRFLGLDFTFEQVPQRDEHHCTILDQISNVVRADDDVVYAGYQGAGKRADAHWISLMIGFL